MKAIIPGEAAAECGPAEEGNVTEGTGGEKHHAKDLGAQRTHKRALTIHLPRGFSRPVSKELRNEMSTEVLREQGNSSIPSTITSDSPAQAL